MGERHHWPCTAPGSQSRQASPVISLAQSTDSCTDCCSHLTHSSAPLTEDQHDHRARSRPDASLVYPAGPPPQVVGHRLATARLIGEPGDLADPAAAVLGPRPRCWCRARPARRAVHLAAQVTPTEVQTMLQLVTSAAVQAQFASAGGTRRCRPARWRRQRDQHCAVSRRAGHRGAGRHTYARASSAPAELGPESATTRRRSCAARSGRPPGRIAGLRKSAASLRLNSLVNQEAVLRSSSPRSRSAGWRRPALWSWSTRRFRPPRPARPSRSPMACLAWQPADPGPGRGFLRDSLDDAVSPRRREPPGRRPGARRGADGTSWRKRDRPAVVSFARPPRRPPRPTGRCAPRCSSPARSTSCARSWSQPGGRRGKTSTLANLGRRCSRRRASSPDGLLRPAQAAARAVLRHRRGRGLTTAILGEDSAGEPGKPTRAATTCGCCPAARPAQPGRAAERAARAWRSSPLAPDLDLVLIDSPPVLPVTDAVVLSRTSTRRARGRGVSGPARAMSGGPPRNWARWTRGSSAWC